MEEQAKPAGGFLKTLLLVLAPLLVGGLLVWGIAKQKPELLGLPKGSVEVQTENQLLIDEVGKLIALPTDEKPTIATITDVEKVKDQVFFRNAQNGDKVLIYVNAKKAILYRQSQKKVIEVGPINISQASSSPSGSAIPSASPKAPEATTQ